MFEEKFGESNEVSKTDALKLARDFNMQEVKWWSALCYKWEKAYKELLRDTEI